MAKPALRRSARVLGLPPPPPPPSPPRTPSRRPGRPRKGVASGRVKKKWRSTAHTAGAKGLYNRNNFCYRNSILQCLIHLPEFNHYLDSVHPTPKCPLPEHGCVICALKALFQAYWNGDRTLRPAKGLRGNLDLLDLAIKDRISPKHPMKADFMHENQCDSFEFLEYLVATLEEIDEDIKAKLFSSRHKTRWTCQHCHENSDRDEVVDESGHGIGLSVNIQGPKRNLTMLEYLRANEYEEELRIRCDSAECTDKYGKKHDGFWRIRHKLFTTNPEILIIRLRRFAQDQDPVTKQLDNVKVMGDVPFSEYLNLGEFTESGDPLLYRLQGVVAHSGKTLKFGHYIAAVRERNGRTFCSINDEHVGKERNGTVRELERPLSRKESFDPYILIYTKA